MRKIVFCFPYKGVGGVSLLFSRFAAYLQDIGYDVAVIDYLDGYMAKNLGKKIELLEYRDTVSLVVPLDSVLILQTMTPWSIYPMLRIHDDIKLYFITTLPINLYPFLPIFRSTIATPRIFSWFIWYSLLYNEYKKMQRFLMLAMESAAISFLDYDIVQNVEKNLRMQLDNPLIIPVFSDSKTVNTYMQGTCVKSISKLVFAWVGRLADFKIHILNRLIQDTDNVAKKLKQPIDIIIVGSGNCANQLVISNFENITIQCIEDIQPRDLDQFLLSIDVLFAMGTSALEGAKLGVPTVRLDYSFKPIKQGYLYKWFYEIDDFSMGQQINTSFYINRGHDLESIVASLKSSSELLSQKTFRHYQKYHSIQASANSLINGLKSTKLTYCDMRKFFLLNSFLYSLWKKCKRIISV